VISITETAAGSPSPRASASSGLSYLDSSLLAMVRLNEKGGKEVAEMRPGAGVWAEYRFQGEDWKLSEMPSMMLQKPPEHLKRPAANMKRPAQATKKPASSSKRRQIAKLPVESAADEGEEEEDDDDDEEVQFEEAMPVPVAKAASKAAPGAATAAAAAVAAAAAPAFQQQYCKMYYKNTNAYGFREKLGTKRQVFQVVSRTWPKARFDVLASEVLQRLNDGVNVLDVHAWAKAKLLEQ
jgi:hypothetical protein